MHNYCWKCYTLDPELTWGGDGSVRTVAVANCKACGGQVTSVSCLVCFDSGEVSALGEERDCPRGCKPKLNFYQKMQWGDAEAARLGAEQALATNLVIYRPSTIPLDTEAADGYTLEDSKGDA